MEAITALAGLIVNLIFGEALKEGGKALGKGVSAQVSQLINVIHQRLKNSGCDGVLLRAEQQPTESNVKALKAELIAQMENDDNFASQLLKMLKQLTKEDVNIQRMLVGIDAESIKAGNLRQDVTGEGSSVQEILSAVKVSNGIEIGDASQVKK
jgi:hypothetical protein